MKKNALKTANARGVKKKKCLSGLIRHGVGSPMKTWQQVRLGLVAQVNPPCARPLGDTLVTFISMADVSNEAKIVTPQIRTFASVATGFTSFEEGDVLVAKITPCFENGKGAFACNLKNGRGAGSTEFHVLRPKPGTDGRFLHWISRTSYFRKTGESRMEGSAGQKRLPANYLRNININLPPLPEQRKIAHILTTWDESLEKLDALIAVKERRKNALMQRLLTGRMRFPSLSESLWKEVHIGELLTRVFRSIEWTADMQLSLVSLRRRCGGLFRRPDILGADYKTRDLHELKSDDFLVSKRQVAHGAWALVPPDFDGSHVSKEYVIFVNASPDKLHMPFFAWLAQTPRMIRLARVASTGVHIEKLIFDPEVFFRESVFIPAAVTEQKRIATTLDIAQAELHLLRAQRDALNQQKRGLMQRLLTGRVRVKPRNS